MSRSRAMLAIASMSSRVSTPPVGLCGELRMISLVRGVTSERNSSGSKRKSSASRSAYGTGVPPAKRVIDS